MSEELQSGEALPEVSAEQLSADQNTGAELAPASDGQHESNAPVVDEATKDAEAKAAEHAATQKAINKKHFEGQQFKRERDALQAQVDETNRKSQESLAQSFANNPVMPVYPDDQFADDFEAKVAQYHQDMPEYNKKLQAKATFDANQNLADQQQQYQQQQAATAQQAEQQKTVTEHNARAAALNIDPVEMQAAQNAVISYGIPDACLMHLVNNSDSPLLFKHLAANPQQGFELAQMAQTNPYGVDTLLNNIVAQSKELKPKQVNAPAPIEQIKGSGAEKPNKYKHSAGAKFK